jgi:colanic acid/amylovoran biosynthesis protein
MKSILITNIVVLNGGDGAILFGMIKILRAAFGADCKIFVYASRPDVASRMFPEIEFRETLGLAATRAPFAHIRYLGRIFRILQQARYMTVAWCLGNGFRYLMFLLPRQQRKFLQEYGEADFLASSGGTYLKEEYGVLIQACDYKLTLFLKKPLIFFTQSLGPFVRPATRRVMKSVFNRSSCILLRDEQSRRNIQDLGVTDVPVHLVADAAFALADPAVIEFAKQPRRDINHKHNIAVSVRHWPHFGTCSSDEGMARYRLSIAETVRKLVLQGAEITFLSTCQGIPEYDDDSVEAEMIIQLMDKDIASKIKNERKFIRFDELMVRLRDFDLCIGTRMHMCILSLISGTPVLPIAYEFKTYELFDQLGLKEWVTDIEYITPDGFAKRIKAFQNIIPSIRKELFSKVLGMHYSALEAGARIKSALEVSN